MYLGSSLTARKLLAADDSAETPSANKNNDYHLVFGQTKTKLRLESYYETLAILDSIAFSFFQ